MSINETIKLFCELEEPLQSNDINIYLNEVSLSYDNNYIIKIIPPQYPFAVKQFDNEIPFLYSGNQIINIEGNNDIYEIKFNFDKYNNEILFCVIREDNTFMILDNYSIEENEIIFKIEKEKIEEIYKIFFNFLLLNKYYKYIYKFLRIE